MSCGPRSPGRTQTGVSILTGTTKYRFSRIHRSAIFYLKNTKFAVGVPTYGRRLNSKFEANHSSCFRDTSDQNFTFFSLFSSYSSSFHTNTKTTLLNSRMYAWNKVKFGTRVGQPKANISTKFGGYPMKILVVISDNSHKQRLICLPAYRVNC